MGQTRLHDGRSGGGDGDGPAGQHDAVPAGQCRGGGDRDGHRPSGTAEATATVRLVRG